MTRAAGRGRRPGGPDTRGAILEAARSSFAHKGYAGTTIRAVAADAGVDPALVHHYFGSKDDLFVASLEIPVDPRQLVPAVFAEGAEGAAERLLRIFFSVWEDPEQRLPLVAMVRASLSGEGEPPLLAELLRRMIFAPIVEVLGLPDGQRRAQLVATQMLGLIIGRYVLRVQPLASMPVDEVVAWVAPTIQRYLTDKQP